MSLFDVFSRAPKKSADAASERLRILLSHERAGLSGADFLPQLQREILDVIRKYTSVDEDRVQVTLEREQDLSILEVNIELPATGTRR